MSRKNIAFACFLLGLLVPFALGVVQYASTKLLPWHVAALGVPWDQLPPGVQAVFAGYLKIAGAGLIGMCIAVSFILLIPYRRGEAWALWAIGTVIVVAPLLVCYGLLTVQLRTGVPQPWYNPLASIGMFVIGFLLTPRGSRTVG